MSASFLFGLGGGVCFVLFVLSRVLVVAVAVSESEKNSEEGTRGGLFKL